MNDKNNEYTKKITNTDVYLAKIEFEDGYDKKQGRNNKIRPVLILDSFYDKKNNTTSYIVAPIYSVKKKDKNAVYNCYINNWKNSFNKNNDFYKAKFKLSQIQIINKKSFQKINNKGIYLYRKISCNSPINSYDLEKLNKKIIKYYDKIIKTDIKNKSNVKLINALNIYLKRNDKIKKLINTKTKENYIPEFEM